MPGRTWFWWRKQQRWAVGWAGSTRCFPRFHLIETWRRWTSGIALIDAVELWSRKPLVDGLGLGLVDVSVGIGVLFVLVGSSIALVAAVVLFGAAQWGRSADSAAPTSLRGSMVHDDV